MCTDNIKVFVLEHVHVIGDGEESVKLIGVYSARANAEKAIDRLRAQPGFSETPEGFTIDTYTLDEDNWEEGYITLRHRAGDNAESAEEREVVEGERSQ